MSQHIFVLADNPLSMMDEDQVSFLILLDVSAASSTVDHKLTCDLAVWKQGQTG